MRVRLDAQSAPARRGEPDGAGVRASRQDGRVKPLCRFSTVH